MPSEGEIVAIVVPSVLMCGCVLLGVLKRMWQGRQGGEDTAELFDGWTLNTSDGVILGRERKAKRKVRAATKGVRCSDDLDSGMSAVEMVHLGKIGEAATMPPLHEDEEQGGASSSGAAGSSRA